MILVRSFEPRFELKPPVDQELSRQIRYQSITAGDQKSEYPSVPHRPAQFNTSVLHKDHTFSAPKIPQFNTKSPSVPHQKPLSSPHPSVPHQKPLYSTHLSVPHRLYRAIGFWCETEGFLVWNWEVFSTEGFRVWNWRILWAEKEWPFCVELVLNGRGCGTEGPQK